jgi:transposase-like protein
MPHRKSLNQKMFEHAALQQQSDKTITSYAKLIGVSRHKLQYWVRKYKALEKIQKARNDSSLKFIDLGSFGLQEQPVKADIPAASLESPAVSPLQDERLPQITLAFPNGMCLKIY